MGSEWGGAANMVPHSQELLMVNGQQDNMDTRAW